MELLYLLLGWLSFNAITFLHYKNKIDKTDKKFSFKKYKEDNWDDWVVTLIIAIPLWLLGPEIFLLIYNTGFLGKSIFWSDKIPYLFGAFGTMIFQGIYDIIKLIIEKFKKKVQ